MPRSRGRPAPGLPPAGRQALRIVVCALVLLAARTARADDLDRGVALFYQQRFEDAVPLLQKTCVRRNGADACAWLAETLRRLGRPEAADSAARVALARDPCHAFAHDVLATNCNPQFGDWPGAHVDSTWAHALRAVECDSTDGNAWLTIWGEAIRRDDRDRERRTYRRLVGDGFLTPPILAYSRWLLARVPERSLLLVNGDMDTYPVLALQALEALRPDVAVVNVSLLELDWYRRLVRDRLDVPMPFGPRALDDLAGYDSSGTWIGASLQVESGWRDMVRTGTMDRPLVYSTTLPMDAYPDRSASHYVMEGAYHRALPWASDEVDTAKIRVCLLPLSPKDFAGAWVSARDRSPIRRAAGNTLVSNVLDAALQYAAARAPDHSSDAIAMMDWAVDFGRRARVPRELMSLVVSYRDQVVEAARQAGAR